MYVIFTYWRDIGSSEACVLAGAGGGEGKRGKEEGERGEEGARGGSQSTVSKAKKYRNKSDTFSHITCPVYTHV